jgi:alanine transaminase
MYAFPRIHLSKKAIKEAASLGVAPDFMYCKAMVDETGIMTVPGSGFGQKKDTYHFRITNLVCPTERMQETLENLKTFNEKFNDKFK